MSVQKHSSVLLWILVASGLVTCLECGVFRSNSVFMEPLREHYHVNYTQISLANSASILWANFAGALMLFFTCICFNFRNSFYQISLFIIIRRICNVQNCVRIYSTVHFLFLVLFGNVLTAWLGARIMCAVVGAFGLVGFLGCAFAPVFGVYCASLVLLFGAFRFPFLLSTAY